MTANVELDELDDAIVNAVRELREMTGRATIREIAETAGCATATAHRRCLELIDRGVLLGGPAGSWRVAQQTTR